MPCWLDINPLLQSLISRSPLTLPDRAKFAQRSSRSGPGSYPICCEQWGLSVSLLQSLVRGHDAVSQIHSVALNLIYSRYCFWQGATDSASCSVFVSKACRKTRQATKQQMVVIHSQIIFRALSLFCTTKDLNELELVNGETCCGLAILGNGCHQSAITVARFSYQVGRECSSVFAFKAPESCLKAFLS